MNQHSALTHLTYITLLTFGLAVDSRAQRVTVTSTPAAPSQNVLAVVTNDTAQPLWFPANCALRFLRHSGEFVANAVPFLGIPRTIVPGQWCDTPQQILPTHSIIIPIQAPDAPGSYTLTFVYGNRAVTRFDVSTPTPQAQQVAFYPTNLRFPQRAHEVDFAAPGNTTWEFANTGAATFTFSPTDRIELSSPGSSVVLATLSLANATIPAGGVTPITLPIAGLTPGPYDVRACHADPGTGSVVTTRSGIRVSDPSVELHMVGGHELNPGESLAMAVSLAGFPAGTGQDPFYILLVGHAPGSTVLPGGNVLPLVLDGLAVGSFTGLGGLLNANIGQVSNVYPAGFPSFEGSGASVLFDHPNIPAVAGLELRVAALGVDAATTVWGASQGETIVLR